MEKAVLIAQGDTNIVIYELSIEVHLVIPFKMVHMLKQFVRRKQRKQSQCLTYKDEVFFNAEVL